VTVRYAVTNLAGCTQEVHVPSDGSVAGYRLSAAGKARTEPDPGSARSRARRQRRRGRRELPGQPRGRSLRVTRVVRLPVRRPVPRRRWHHRLRPERAPTDAATASR
jgi:hypothetical protein